MNITKECPQCNTTFSGRSNQVYCSNRCKVEAFRNGKTQKTQDQPVSVIGTESVPPIVLPRAVNSQSSRSIARTDLVSNRVQLEMRRLELDHERQIKQMEMDEAARCRTYEQEMTRTISEKESRQQEQATKSVSEIPTKPLSPLAEWSHFPIGIRRQYQTLVSVALKAAEGPIYSSVYKRWLDEYRFFNGAVQDIIARKTIPILANKPFIWLAELAQLVEDHQVANPWSYIERQLILSVELHRNLTQACL